ncbi:uncharacterized protein [Euphorbia lathyris]|uniref:uncharacterized protein n=1 Tax=Euphorbia lathyris TaxID=212925 RepID=UPI0033141934
MEMDPVNSDDNSTEGPSFEQLILPSSNEISGISGDPQIYPRVGDEYQAEIPPMISETERFRVSLTRCDSEGIFDGYDFFVGLPMPVAWIHNKRNAKADEGCRRRNLENPPNANRSTKSRTSRKKDTVKKKDLQQNAEVENLVMDSRQESTGTKAELKDEQNYLVPASLGHAWSDAEVDAFILGLYIFRKNFAQIKRFLGKKEMGDILSFYYGEFYKSNAYRRWLGCRKKRRKKCAYGRKLFTGWRQEELVSRLHPRVPEHSQNTLLEVSKAFLEGKFSLEAYVCELKTIAGIQALVDAMGIGTGKTDLTSLSMVPGKTNPLFTVCPSGKTCSSLTYSDIIKLLTGDFRLSKARCNDIFWDSVWPRLLARGWHSEQPKNESYLVFLIPGVKKFSKTRLSKGKQYFDSVSDVLNKVASEPKLIELEDEEAGANEEENSAAEVPSGQGDPSIRQPHRYLKPRVSNMKVVRFTVVDSSFVGGKLCKMREMRYLPHELKVKSLLTTLSSGIEMKFLDNSESKVERITVNKSWDGVRKKASDDCSSNRTKFTIVDTSLMHDGNPSKVRELRFAPRIKATSETKNPSRKRKCPSKGSSGVPVSDAKTKLLNEEKNICKSNQNKDTVDSCESDEPLNRKFLNKFVESLQDKNNVSDKNQSAARTIKHQFSRRSKSGQSNNLVPVVKRRRLTACSNTDLNRVIKSFSVGQGSKREGSCCSLNSSDRRGNTSPGTTSLVGEGLEESSRSMSETPCLGVETSQGENLKHETRSCIDLNQPQVPLDLENGEPADQQPNPVSASTDVSPNPIRQSKRNRPLTTRALEALEYGFISMKRQRSIRVHGHELSASVGSCRKTKGTSNRVNNSSEHTTNVAEGDANGALEKKDVVEEIPVAEPIVEML